MGIDDVLVLNYGDIFEYKEDMMIDSTILGAMIQALPTLILAFVAWRGLSSWKQEAKEPRRIQLAETCLVSAHQLVDMVTEARADSIRLPESQIREPLDAFMYVFNEQRIELIKNCLVSWKEFSKNYRAVKIYLRMPDDDIPRILHKNINRLWAIATVLMYYQHPESSPLPRYTRDISPESQAQLASAKEEFCGIAEDKEDFTDSIGLEIQSCIQRLEKILLNVTQGY